MLVIPFPKNYKEQKSIWGCILYTIRQYGLVRYEFREIYANYFLPPFINIRI